MAHAFCAKVGVDNVNMRPHADGMVGADRFADIAIDALVGNP